jgi:hypothetical protein
MTDVASWHHESSVTTMRVRAGLADPEQPSVRLAGTGTGTSTRTGTGTGRSRRNNHPLRFGVAGGLAVRSRSTS